MYNHNHNIDKSYTVISNGAKRNEISSNLETNFIPCYSEEMSPHPSST